MPAPAPKSNNAQHQTLTTILRNIILEYPSGGGVLRELCQNADDAGATTIEFVLDTKTHITTDILHPDLAEYQGPALLAYSDSMFTEEDFESLSRIGDSRKASDMSVTGKFGRGFNSVYNWTDTPSILSGGDLLILDPHFTWSKAISPESPGGPRWDYVESIKKGFGTMRNQLSAFSSIIKEFDNPFPGTIIRLPLRTSLNSKIVPGKPTSQEDILEVFEKFAKEIVDSLLFLRNVNTIVMRVDSPESDSFYAKAVVTAEGRDGVNKGFKEVFVEQIEEVCEKDFVMEIALETIKGEEKAVTVEKFVISHYMKKEAENKQLQEWAREKKLFPWIAVATPVEANVPFNGRLFSTLPLPVHTKHPVHIHGLFSITPDRSNIHAGGDQTMSGTSDTKLGAFWNTWLFRECLPHVWIRNIDFLNGMPEGKHTGWDFWPAGIQGEEQAGQLWMGVLSLVFQRIVKRDLKLLPTICGRVGKKGEILFASKVEEAIRDALSQAGCLVVIPPEDRRSELSKLKVKDLGIEELTVAAVRDSLSKLKDSLENLTPQNRGVLLDYVLSSGDYENLGFCFAPLLPILNDKFCSFDHSDHKLFFPMTMKEAELFKHYPRMIDRKKLSTETYQQMRKGIKELDHKTCISTWTTTEAASYCEKYIFTNPRPARNANFITLQSSESRKFVELFWDWVGNTGKNNYKQLSANPSVLDGLWLIPTMEDGIYHRISTTERRFSILDVSNEGYISKFLEEAACRPVCDGTQYPIYTGEGTFSVFTSTLRGLGYIDNAENVEYLISWLVENSTNFVDRLPEESRNKLLEHLGREVKMNIKSEEKKIAARERIGMLRLFREAVPTGDSHDDPPNQPWISLKDGFTYIGIGKIPVKLDADHTKFIDTSQYTGDPLISIGLMLCPPIGKIIEDFVVPKIKATRDLPLRVQLVTFALAKFEELSDECKQQLSRTEIVPVDEDGEMQKCPADVVDRGLEEYFFPEEYRTPSLKFYNKYISALRELGMASEIDHKFVLDRILEYSQKSYTTREVREKAEKLIMNYKPLEELPEEYLMCQWIPASFAQKDGLYNATECRGLKDGTLVKYAMPVMKIPVSQEWESVLGWNKPLEAKYVLRQLKGVTEAKDSTALRHLITYEMNTLIECKEDFIEEEWVPDTRGFYHRACDIFPRDLPYGDFSPYFGTLPLEFRKNPFCISLLEQMGMNYMPTFCQLKELQDRLAAKEPLSGNDLRVALFIVKEVGARFAEEDLDGFKAPDSKCLLLPLGDLTAGDPGPDDADRAILHQEVSLETIKQLSIVTFQNRSLDSLVDLNFEGDFAQRESPATAISDTLERYGANTTFNEYLANAEDSGSATKITWILDNSEYKKEKLISKELEKAQGPALFCFNDGLFSERDFRAVIDIGVGSKQNDRSKIGKFGRGALTMYHWTSVPSFISGDSFVIFDPEEQYLPLNSETRRRRAGMKLKLKDVRNKYRDQLLPFEDICGFNGETTYFNGTLFRFPMRLPNCESRLKKGNIDLGKTREYLMTYYKDAINSLLFLGKVKEISFIEKNSKEPVWEVSRKDLAISAQPENIKEFIIDSRCTADEGVQLTNRKWCVISGKKSEEDLDNNELVKVSIENRLEARYGLAALMSPQEEGFRGKNYMTLPLRRSGTMEIPVHVDANMVVQSNRMLTTPLEESEMEESAEWNKWILEKGVGRLYLILVNYLMQNHGDTGYNYWPPYPSENSDPISKTISTAFWNRLSTSPYRLYPLAAPEKNPSAVDSNDEKSFKLKFSDVVFDLLEPDVSKFVVPLLLRLGVHNIVSPPPKIKKYLIECQAKPIELLSSSYFLNHLRRHSSKLLQIWKEFDPKIDPEHDTENDPENSPKNEPENEPENGRGLDFFNSLFSFIFRDFFNHHIPSAGEVEIPDLKGSTLLPLADKNLGTFRPKESADCYLVARTPQERSLLDSVPRISVHPDFDEDVVKSLMMCDLNIKYFEFADVPRVYKEINDRKDSEFRIGWLKEMWEYYETYIYLDPGQEGKCLDILKNLEVYFGDRVGQNITADTVFVSPAQFSSGSFAAVLKQEPKNTGPNISKLLDSFQGLILLDRSAFPKKQLPKEHIGEFTGVLGFNRLLKSIEILALETQHSIEEYIIESLKMDGIEVLRELLEPTMMTVLLKESSQSKSLLEQLPIWPSETRDISLYRTAQTAMLAPEIDIPFDALPENVVFIKASVANAYRSQLGQLCVKKMNIDELLTQNVRQGQSIQANKIQRYKTFLRVLYQNQTKPFSTHPLAINGERTYCMVNSLYCAKDKYFRAAFRDLQKTHFLFPALQDLTFWHDAGLRKDKTEYNYLECVRSIERRRRESSIPESDQLVTDAETIYDYLKFDAQDMERWAPETWQILNDTPFPVKAQLGPSHRVSQMRLVRGSSHFAKFRRSVIQKYEDIAWSQCPILSITPGRIVLAHINLQGGAPSTKIVLDHLMFLSENRLNVQKHQISPYIQDVEAAYQYLQKNKTSIISKDRKAKIWLNIEAEDEHTITLEEFFDSWKCSEDLCLNKYTSGKVQPALSFLIPFAPLLEFYGVEKVVPPPPPPGPIEFEDRSEILLAAFRRFRQEGKFFDIIFEVEGQRVRSHKAILAAASEYFETMFSGNWKESTLAVIQLSDDFKASTVSAVFDYIYSGEIPALDQEAEVERTYHHLIHQLELSNLWLLEDLKVKLGDQLCCEHMIRLETVTYIRQCAAENNVPRLLSVCDEYIRNNRRLVQRELSCGDNST